MIAGRWILTSLMVSTLATWAATAYGQKQDEKRNDPRDTSTLSLKFSGGSLADYVKALKEAAPDLNVIIAVPEARDIKVPAIQLESVSPGSAIGLLQGTYPLNDGTPINLFIQDWGGSPAESAARVYKIWTNPREMARPPADVRVWSIGDLFLGDRKAEQILTAIETAVGLLKGYPEAQIRYHADTTLVVASGDPDQLRTIDRVVDGIRRGMKESGHTRGDEQSGKLSELIQSLKESASRPDANISLHQTGQNDNAKLVQLLEGLQQELREKDNIIRELQKQVQGKPQD